LKKACGKHGAVPFFLRTSGRIQNL